MHEHIYARAEILSLMEYNAISNIMPHFVAKNQLYILSIYMILPKTLKNFKTDIILKPKSLYHC